jgi:chromosome segregation ATPase
VQNNQLEEALRLKKEMENHVKSLLNVAEDDKRAIAIDVERLKSLLNASEDDKRAIAIDVERLKSLLNASEGDKITIVNEVERLKSLLNASEDDKSAILNEVERFRTVCNDSQETISTLECINKAQSDALELAQCELVTCRNFENKFNELKLTNTVVAEMNQRYESELLSLKCDLDHFKQSLNDCQHSINELTVQNNQLEEALRIKNEVILILELLRDLHIIEY